MKKATKTKKMSAATLNKAAAIQKEIETLEAELGKILNFSSQDDGGLPAEVVTPLKTNRKPLSTEARAKIAAAQHRRWGKVKGLSFRSPKTAIRLQSGNKQHRKPFSPATRRKMADAARARWAGVHSKVAA